MFETAVAASASAHGPGIPIGAGLVLPIDIILFAAFLAYYLWFRRKK